ncbi:hypothetical protein IAF05_04140 [Dickeya dianthicola]|uniref:hypothetical protein n=1 Tax=Dickeya dianthicola TaxID=204039 RepID=UPI001BDEA911|nr:hypothetical protein [Dickeya dianthicola]MBT1426920.1 hypothetical protein [Dickeya dianthicola]MBT1458439.1 hypothetical protein [Dickeya dianthicola]MBT1487579.1 hypothetical protein [Dickeya dianthicola]
MTWRRADICLSSPLPPVTCSVLPVHPWVYGVGNVTDNGHYLSPANAVAYLAERLGAAADNLAVCVWMVCGSGLGEFLQALDALTVVFPAPALSQVARQARAMAELATVKMQIPAKSRTLPATAPLSVASCRQALNAQRMAAAQQQAAVPMGLDFLKGMAERFTSQRDAALSEISQTMQQMAQCSALAWVFTGQGAPGVIAAEMLKNIPKPSAIYTAAMMFTGKELDALESMIREPDNYTRP